MSKLKIVLNSSEIRKFLKSQEVADCVLDTALEVAGRAGEGYSTDVYNASSRVISSVYAETAKAKKDNMKNNTLLKAVSR